METADADQEASSILTDQRLYQFIQMLIRFEMATYTFQRGTNNPI